MRRDRFHHLAALVGCALLCSLSSGCGRSDRSIDVSLGGTAAAPRLLLAQAPAADAASEAKAADAESKSAPAAEDGSSGATLSGRVVYKGKPPAPRVINMSKDAKCVELHGSKPLQDQDLIVAADGGLQNAFVRVQRGAPKRDYPMPKDPAVLDQSGCMFHPRVQGIRVGQQLLVKNADPVTHNVRSFPVLNPAFNFGQPPDTDPRIRVFEHAEREIEIQCDFHLWMHAYIFVMDHPFYAVSAADGSFKIESLPPGEYTLEVWHEKLGKQRQKATVADQDVADVTFTYSR